MQDVNKKFSFEAKKSCFMQETKIFRQGPPHLMILFDGEIFKQEILIRCENFLCYASNEKISPRPRPQN